MENVLKMVSSQMCTGCLRCLLFCPQNNLVSENGDLGFPVPHIKDPKLCDGCSECMKACPFSDEFDENEDK